MRAIIISVSSDIGLAMADRWLTMKWDVSGTFRTKNAELTKLQNRGLNTFPMNLSDASSVGEACESLRAATPPWDVLVLAAGDLNPVGTFQTVDFREWENSVVVNFSRQLQAVHALLPHAASGQDQQPLVLFFSGGGTNSATTHYSAYTVSKIALVKMCELLDAEIPNIRFAILGPGWVKTKIHEATLNAGEHAGINYSRTLSKIDEGDWVPMQTVLECCDWIISAPRNVVSGRNFSVVHDAWRSQGLESTLSNDPALFKLRRNGNELAVPSARKQN